MAVDAVARSMAAAAAKGAVVLAGKSVALTAVRAVPGTGAAGREAAVVEMIDAEGNGAAVAAGKAGTGARAAAEYAMIALTPAVRDSERIGWRRRNWSPICHRTWRSPTWIPLCCRI